VNTLARADERVSRTLAKLLIERCKDVAASIGIVKEREAGEDRYARDTR
jgi:hypothetical protein